MSIDLIFDKRTFCVATTTFGYDLTLYCPPAQDQVECQLRVEPLTLSSVVHWLPDVAAPLPQRLLYRVYVPVWMESQSGWCVSHCFHNMVASNDVAIYLRT